VTLSGATADHRTDSKREGPVLPRVVKPENTGP
jgi:hypothetical protein